MQSRYGRAITQLQKASHDFVMENLEGFGGGWTNGEKITQIMGLGASKFCTGEFV